jgi:filamentous hemagglutinin family protein
MAIAMNKFFGFCSFCTIFSGLIIQNHAFSQIIPDQTLPVNSQVTIQGNIDLIEGGTVRGTHLFHSFWEFSTPMGRIAEFNATPEIQNIFTRITGNAISEIDGVLRSPGQANLFLINPNGIIFGPNAALDIRGSLLVTTADAIQFADGLSPFGPDL